MTENETKQKLDSLHYKILHTSFCNKVYESEIKALCMAKDTLSEIRQYREYKEIFESHFSEEALKLLSNKEEFGKWLERGKWIAKRCDEINRELEQYRAIGTVEEVRMLKDYKELYDVYKLIGTIEEFRNLKYKKNVLPIATIEFSKEDMQKMVDEKVAQIELDIQEIRAKVIDEFAEALKEMLKDIQFAEFQSIDVCPCAKTGEECPYINQDDIGCQYCAREQTIKEIDEIAEQLKAGGKNED